MDCHYNRASKIRAINPITGTNWEGVGIAPDIAVSAADALRAAHLDALNKIRATATDPEHRKELDRAIAALLERK